MAFDLECARDALISLLQNELPAKVAAINAEKADGNDIQDIPAVAWIPGANEEIWNYEELVFYYLTNVVDDTGGSSTNLDVALNVLVAFVYSQDGLLYENKCLRYARAFQEILNENKYDIAASSYLSDIRVQTIYPADTPATIYERSTGEHNPFWKTAGVQIRFNLAT